MEDTNIKEADIIANEIMDYSRDKLLVNMRFLDVALSYHKRVAYEGTIGTDGKNIMYNPIHILQLYKKSQSEMVRAYFHLIFHCIFHHPFVGPAVDERLWNLACDMAVETTISDMGLQMLSSPRETKQKKIVSELKKEIPVLTAEKIYSVFKNADYPDWAVKQWESAFTVDDHIPWYQWVIEVEIANSNSDNPQVNKRIKPYQIKTLTEYSEVKDFWGNVSSHMQMEVENFIKQRGIISGNMIQNLRSVNRERYDYTSFLKKFAVLGEAMKVNEDEFDYIYYTYGLAHYDNMPLIEPLEYKEVKRIKEFVIVIDTSGSVMGDEVQMFLQKTYNILMQEDSFFSRINIHIIQCDAEIQEDFVIHNREEFEEYIKKMKIRGFGGTDFRPVFDYVDQLIAEKRFNNLKGLIYFTDGYGVFPARKPRYTTAFVFVKNDYEIPEVPPWAIRLILQKEEIMM